MQLATEVQQAWGWLLLGDGMCIGGCQDAVKPDTARCTCDQNSANMAWRLLGTCMAVEVWCECDCCQVGEGMWVAPTGGGRWFRHARK